MQIEDLTVESVARMSADQRTGFVALLVQRYPTLAQEVANDWTVSETNCPNSWKEWSLPETQKIWKIRYMM